MISPLESPSSDSQNKIYFLRTDGQPLKKVLKLLLNIPTQLADNEKLFRSEFHLKFSDFRPLSGE